MPLDVIHGELSVAPVFLLEGLAVLQFEHVAELLHLPAVGDGAEGGIEAGDGFVAGVAEVDEPLAVEGAGHRL